MAPLSSVTKAWDQSALLFSVRVRLLIGLLLISVESSMEAAGDNHQVAIIGGGLVGSLAAIYMARLGYDVVVFEKRPGNCQSSRVHCPNLV